MREELHVKDIITRMKNYQTKWLENVERMEDQQIPKIIFKHNPAGNRDPGRPQMRQKEQFLI
jgi:hypothetical protein